MTREHAASCAQPRAACCVLMASHALRVKGVGIIMASLRCVGRTVLSAGVVATTALFAMAGCGEPAAPNLANEVWSVTVDSGAPPARSGASHPSSPLPTSACGSIGATCGPVVDDCGVTVDCGACPSGQQCDLQSHQCSACPTLSCTAFGAACGTITDGCGAQINCGGCASPLVCDLFAQNCVACTTATCAMNDCGSKSDGCGGVLDCGGCTGAAQCQQGSCVVPPLPAGCGVAGSECGPVVNECGDTVVCGVCAGSDSCFSGTCGPCVSPTCAGVFCGDVTECDGSPLHCGDCESGDTCNMGSCCTPQTCADLPPNSCGGSDGCNGFLDCAPCPNGEGCASTGLCVAPPACVPANPCATECGVQSDGCGNLVNCPQCAPGQTLQ